LFHEIRFKSITVHGTFIVANLSDAEIVKRPVSLIDGALFHTLVNPSLGEEIIFSERSEGFVVPLPDGVSDLPPSVV